MVGFAFFTEKLLLIYLIAQEEEINEEGYKSCKINKRGGGNKREQGGKV